MKVCAEDIELIKIHEWVKNRTTLPFIHCANERSCTPQYGAILKKKGQRAGVSDILIPRAAKGFHGAWIELKVGKNKPSLLQQQFLDDMTKEGYFAACVWGSEAAIAMIRELYDIHDL